VTAAAEPPECSDAQPAVGSLEEAVQMSLSWQKVRGEPRSPSRAIAVSVGLTG
jgi:hypothetical protein